MSSGTVCTRPVFGALRALLAAGLLTVTVVVATGCEAGERIGSSSPGVLPPDDQLNFPSGLALDPRPSQLETGTVCSVWQPELDEAGTVVADAAGNSVGYWADVAGACGPTGRCVRPRRVSVAELDALKDLPMQANTCRYDDEKRWLFITNANSSRTYNSSTLVALDLERFFCVSQALGPLESGCRNDIWSRQRHENTGEPTSLPLPSAEDLADYDPYATEADGSLVDLLPERPCRPLANKRHVVECTEEPFIDAAASVHLGEFSGDPAIVDLDETDDSFGILIPVRSDPSVTWANISGGRGAQSPVIECGQGRGAEDLGGDEVDVRECSNRHRIMHELNEPLLARINREPFGLTVSQQSDRATAFVTHANSPFLSVIALEGEKNKVSDADEHKGEDAEFPHLAHSKLPKLSGAAGPPTLVLSSAMFTVDPTRAGGFGIAERPCPNRSVTGCERPLLYGAYRYLPTVLMAAILEPRSCGGRKQIGSDSSNENLQIQPKECRSGLDAISEFNVGGLSTTEALANPTVPILADVAFSNDGNWLYTVLSSPGALIAVDTRYDPAEGRPYNDSVGQVEVCSEPTELEVYETAEGQRWGFVSCYRSAEVFVIDLDEFRVVKSIRAGTGAHAMLVDEAREVLFVANFLDATVSVIDLSPRRLTRFSEVARIGIQDPF